MAHPCVAGWNSLPAARVLFPERGTAMKIAAGAVGVVHSQSARGIPAEEGRCGGDKLDSYDARRTVAFEVQ